ncbi:MAG: ABC transporter ATP-binding protein [Alphaproteobacteria bacterium]|nr:ABC transporter ATP-binding protein [Alphaproteobacteria bacterium]
MIKIENISKNFGKKVALNNVNLRFKKGEIIALIGENGAGKSTLMRIMCGYLPQTIGKVSIFGNDINDHRIKALSYIGYVPELSVLYSEMYVYDFLLWIAGIWNINDKKEAIISAAKQMQIIDVLGERIENLSKGYKKRVEIASAILHKPKFLILDEPTDGLDPNQKHDIRTFMKKYAKENIVLVSTHVLEDADIANRVVMLSQGKVINDTSIKEFKKVSCKNNLSEAFRILSANAKDKK